MLTNLMDLKKEIIDCKSLYSMKQIIRNVELYDFSVDNVLQLIDSEEDSNNFVFLRELLLSNLP